MDFDLPDELVVLKDAAARFAADRIAPHAREWDRTGAFPDSILDELAEQGFLGILVPEAYGGAGGNHLSFAVILEEIARHDGGLALSVEAHNGLAVQHVLLVGTEEQKEAFLPALASGESLGAWCLTEPGAGTDAAAIRTSAVRDGDEWVLDGSKQFITNGSRAGTFVVVASTREGGSGGGGGEGGRGKDSESDRGRAGLSAFVVDGDTPGLTVGEKERKLGMRSSDTVSVHLDDVRVPESRLLGEPGNAFDDVKKVLVGGRVMISALSLGLARGALEESVEYANERESFGRPIIEHQLLQSKLADMVTRIEAARLLVYRGARFLDEGRETVFDSAVTKLFTSEMATDICMEAIQIHGGYGYLSEYDVERYMRDAKLCEIGEGTSEILRVLIARSLQARPGGQRPKPPRAESP
ncbi:MAG: acyl-CoA dehydrogenase family protein [Longimicrobiales bacterium]|nr:acyl-CoA dehydrogenase family protein [Longimicrobiales bacterium]